MINICCLCVTPLSILCFTNGNCAQMIMRTSVATNDQQDPRKPHICVRLIFFICQSIAHMLLAKNSTLTNMNWSQMVCWLCMLLSQVIMTQSQSPDHISVSTSFVELLSNWSLSSCSMLSGIFCRGLQPHQSNGRHPFRTWANYINLKYFVSNKMPIGKDCNNLENRNRQHDATGSVASTTWLFMTPDACLIFGGQVRSHESTLLMAVWYYGALKGP